MSFGSVIVFDSTAYLIKVIKLPLNTPKDGMYLFSYKTVKSVTQVEVKILADAVFLEGRTFQLSFLFLSVNMSVLYLAYK